MVFSSSDRSDVFAVIGPLFRAINNQQGAIIALKAGDETRFDEKMTITSQQLDAALDAITVFLGGKP